MSNPGGAGASTPAGAGAGAGAGASSEELALSSGRGRWVLTAMVLGSGIALLDSTVVSIALPSIGREFHGGVGTLQWVVTGYSLTLAAFLLLGGSLGDRYGRKRIFSIGVVWFAAASAVCGIAPTAGLLIAAASSRVSVARCWPRPAWPSCRPRSAPTTGPGPSAPGPG